MSSTRYRKTSAYHCHHIWVVGNIHGNYQLLQSRLHQLSFCPEADLPISIGDNIDHGPESLNVLHPLSQLQFTSARSNHEAMTLEAFETGDGDMRLASGGGWFFDSNDLEQREAIDLPLKFHHLSHVIEITSDIIKYVTAHTDYPGKEYQFDKEMTESELLQPVDRVQKSLNSELQKINGADFFIFDHMMFDNIQTSANQIYIDTGPPKSGQLSFYKIRQFHVSSVKHE